MISTKIDENPAILAKDTDIPRPTFSAENVSDIRSSPPIYISHEQKPPVLATQFLEDAKAHRELISTAFDPSSRWKFPVDLEARPYDQDPIALMRNYLIRTHQVYVLAQHSLASINWFGYNDHGPLHIQRVCEKALEIAQQADFNVPEMRRILASAAFHDLGNLINRDYHSIESPEIAKAIFPALTDMETNWQVIERAIQVHDLATHKWALKNYLDLPAVERIRAMTDIFGDEALALIIADKVQFSRERVNDKALRPAAIYEHRYSQLNLYWETTRAEYDPQSKSFVWELTFRPDVKEDEYMRFKELATASEYHDSHYGVIVPDSFRQAYFERGRGHKTYFRSAEELFWKYSTKLVRLVVEASFGLFSRRGDPSMEKFVLRLIDRGALGIQPSHTEYVFAVDDIDLKLQRHSTK